MSASCSQMSKAEFVSRSSDTLGRDVQSYNPSKEDEKRQSGSPRVISASMGPLEGDEEPTIMPPGYGVSRNGDALSKPVASKKDEDEDEEEKEEEEEEEEDDDEKAPFISNLSRDDGRGRFLKHDDGQEDAPTINTISTEDAALTKSTDDEENPANVPPISNTASDASKTIRQHRTTSAGGSGSRDITSPVSKGGDVWYCCRCKDYNNNRITPRGVDIGAHRKCTYSDRP